MQRLSPGAPAQPPAGSSRRPALLLVTSNSVTGLHTRRRCRSSTWPDRSTPRARRRRAHADDAAAKNRPLVDDIRLLGRILGDVIREQEGDEAFELIERVRQLSVAYRLKRDAVGRPRARPPAEEPVGRPDGERDPRLQLLLATWPTSPRTATMCAGASTTRRQGHLQEGSLAMTFERLRRRRHPRRRDRPDAGSRPTSRRC